MGNTFVGTPLRTTFFIRVEWLKESEADDIVFFNSTVGEKEARDNFDLCLAANAKGKKARLIQLRQLDEYPGGTTASTVVEALHS